MAIFFVAAAASPADAFSLSIVNDKSLAFGSLIAGSGGTVIIAPSSTDPGTRTKTGGVVLMSNAPTYHQASFTVKCVPTPPLNLDCLLTLYYSISPVSGTTLTSGAHSMSVGSFLPYSVNNSGNSSTGILPLLNLFSNSDTLKVGATLTVGNNQAPGNYSGTYSVTVTYP